MAVATPSRVRVRHPLPPARWPTREEAEQARWFSPVRLGARCLAAERTWVPAMVPWRATEDGHVTPEVLEWYGRFAEGQPGVLVVEATGIRDVPSGPLLRIGSDRFVPGLRRLVETVRERSAGRTRLFIQVIDFVAVRRRPEPATFFARYLEIGDDLRRPPGRGARRRALAGRGRGPGLPRCGPAWPGPSAPSSRPCSPRASWSRSTTATASGWATSTCRTSATCRGSCRGSSPRPRSRAREAGFDGVELHYAHAYTMASFLSRTNRRTDGYGGARPERARLPLEVLHTVRNRVGADYVVGIRYLGHDVVAGGNDVDDAVVVRAALRRGPGATTCRCRRAAGSRTPGSPRSARRSTRTPASRATSACPPWSPTRAARSAATCRWPRPSGRASGRRDTRSRWSRAAACRTFDQAEGILARGEADIVAAARQTLADPDWFRKIRLGYGHLVRRCEFTNYCEGLDQRHKQVTCKLWDREPRPG